MCVFQSGFEPVSLKRTKIENFVRFGYISCKDGDKLSYAKQASEGSFIVLDDITFIKVEHVMARAPKETNYNAIVFGLTKEEASKLVKWTSLAKTRWCRRLQVHFELKDSYFQRLHKALDNISHEIILKIMPVDEDFIEENRQEWHSGKPGIEALKLDSYQERALHTILNCSPKVPVLVTGPSGTGKTRLLARAVYEILKSPRSTVLICAHHQASVDTFVEFLAEAIDYNIMMCVERPFYPYYSKTRDTYKHLFVPIYDLPYSLENSGKRLVITTFGTSYYMRLSSTFSHILIDQGAMSREPEVITPLCNAHKLTKIIIAGDHLQVCRSMLLFFN